MQIQRRYLVIFDKLLILQVKNKIGIPPAKNLRIFHTNLEKWFYFDVLPTGLQKKNVNCWSIIHSTIYTSNDISVNDGPHIRRWSHNIIILTIVLQLPTVFSTVTCCTGL